MIKQNTEEINAIIKPVQIAAAEIATRKIETIQSVDIKSDSILLTLYDNGEIDGDTVSVLLNGKVIMPMQGLSAKAINKTDLPYTRNGGFDYINYVCRKSWQYSAKHRFVGCSRRR